MNADTEADLWASHLAGKRIVTIGGGTGPFALLSRLKRYPCQVTAIVTMSDSGGSSRRLMDEFGQLPFGDLRQALVALSRRGALWRDIFNYRFREAQRLESDYSESLPRGSGVAGHSLGNLIISALQVLNEDNLLWAIEDAQELLETAGRVLPVTLSHVTLCAELADEQHIRGETDIDTRGEQALARGEDIAALPPIKRLYLEPEAEACAEALRAIRRADVVVLGPGDLYTSILPNLLVTGVAEALRASEAHLVYVCNLMTKPGETDGYAAADFVGAMHRHLGDRVDRVILHDGSFPAHLLDHYAAQGQHPVAATAEAVAAVRALVPEVLVAPLLAIHQETLVRHDADHLLRTIFAAHPREEAAVRAEEAVAAVPAASRHSRGR